jgi:RNA polymerase sigma factor (TIGR02999 family)
MNRWTRELQESSVRRLQDYLLGLLSRRERDKIERRLVEDEDFYQQLVVAEDFLIEDYARGALPSDQHARVAKLVQTSSSWREKVDFARATRVLIERKTKQSSVTSESEFVEALYHELRALARKALGKSRDSEIEPGELVSEAWMTMTRQGVTLPDRNIFLARAARQMRRVLIDASRARMAAKRGGETSRVDVGGVAVEDQRMLEVDLALEALSELHPRAGKVVEMRFFGGLTEEEIANVLGISARTVKRDWMIARGWLHSYMTGSRAIQ